MTTIAVFGCGFVGGTTADFLEGSGGYEVIRVDPVHHPDQDPKEAAEKADGVIICVPTPMANNGECDDSIVRDVLDIVGTETRVLLKSTVTLDRMSRYPSNVVYNPEFLRERCAMEDFENTKFLIYGHHNNLDDASWWAEIFEDCFYARKDFIESHFVDRRTASMIKYVHNSWLATKVAWFHELFLNLPDGVDYSSLTDILGKFERVGNSHMAAPNFDGTLGYGGACFPKDVSALTSIIDHEILKKVQRMNYELNKVNVGR